jgi:imidazolonepropionase
MTESLPLMMTLACTQMGMTCPEAWLAVTANAARALGRIDVGRLASGLRADFVLFDAPDPATIPYHMAENTVSRVFKYGRPALRGGR